MKELWRLLLPGMNVPACGIEQDLEQGLEQDLEQASKQASSAGKDDRAVASSAHGIPAGEPPPQSGPAQDS